MLIAPVRSLPKDAEFHLSELESFAASLRHLIIEITGQPPEEQNWLSPGSFAYKHQPRGTDWEKMGWLKAYNDGLQISKRYFESLVSLYAGELHVGDRITAHVVVGPQARTGDITTIGDVHSYEGSIINLAVLAEELSLLRKALRTEATSTEHDVAIGAVASAEQAALHGDHKGVLLHLKNTGKWCLEIASKIGVNIATEAIKSAIGFGHGGAA